MFQVQYDKNKITVWMHGTRYVLTNPADVAAFKGDRGWFSTLTELVGAYLDKLVLAVKRVSSAFRVARADMNNYLSGSAPLTFWQEQKMRWCN